MNHNTTLIVEKSTPFLPRHLHACSLGRIEFYVYFFVSFQMPSRLPRAYIVSQTTYSAVYYSVTEYVHTCVITSRKSSIRGNRCM